MVSFFPFPYSLNDDRYYAYAWLLVSYREGRKKQGLRCIAQSLLACLVLLQRRVRSGLLMIEMNGWVMDLRRSTYTGVPSQLEEKEAA